MCLHCHLLTCIRVLNRTAGGFASWLLTKFHRLPNGLPNPFFPISPPSVRCTDSEVFQKHTCDATAESLVLKQGKNLLIIVTPHEWGRERTFMYYFCTFRYCLNCFSTSRYLFFLVIKTAISTMRGSGLGRLWIKPWSLSF